MEETLNIDSHTRRLICKALNKYRFQRQAAKALGVTQRTLINLKQEYGVIFLDDTWQIPEKSPSKRPLQSVA